MSVFPPPDDRLPPTLRTFATTAQLEDYLESQAFDLESETSRGRLDPALKDVAASFAELARANGLHKLAERFEGLLSRRSRRAKNG